MKGPRISRVLCLNFMSKMLHGLLAVLIFFCLFSLIGQSEWKNYRIDHYAGTNNHEETDWIFRQGDRILASDVQLPYFTQLETGKQYSLSTELTYDGSRDNVPYAFFYIHHMHCQAYLDGELMMSYMPEDIQTIDNARSPGNIYVGFPLPPDCLGKTFEIRFVSSLESSLDLELPRATFGDYPTMMHSRFVRDLPQNIIGVLAAFLGVVAILFSTVALSGLQYREGICIGLFALVFSIYNLTESPYNLYLFSNPYYTYLLNYTTFSLMPVTLLAFLREKYSDPLRRRICMLLSCLGMVLLFLEWILHFHGIVDMREFLKVIHMEYFGGISVIFIITFFMKDRKTKRELVLQLLPILIGMILDAGVYYLHWNLTDSDAAFSSLGIVIFLIFELRHVWKSSIEIYAESIRSKYYQEMALEDKLTGVGNRRAFEEEKQALVSGERTYETILVASADVNDLKQTNDTLGHSEGDYLIKSTAQVLSGITEGCGKTFRTGGDEFIMFLYDVSLEEFERKQQEARVRVHALNDQGRAFLSIALGWEFVEGLDIESAVQKADRRMYVDKSKKKEYIRSEYGKE